MSKKSWWLIGLGIALVAVATFVGFNITQPVISCTAQASPSAPPATLVTAQDYFTQGNYQYDLGNCDAAIAAFTRALELDPSFAEAFNNRAFTFMVKKDYKNALPDLDRAIQLRPNYVNALMNRGDIYNYYYAIDRKLALADYDRVLALGPGMYRHTSLCGHRMLARHNGWDLNVFVELLTRGVDSGCMTNATH